MGVNGEKGSNQLVSRCGALVGGGPSASMYNALSGDGETVFFTAEPESACGQPGPATAEVYARVHGSLLSPLAAETVDVSESECTETCGGASGKNFEGASESGKTAFFTSTQKLTDNAVDGTVSGDDATKQSCSGIPEGEGGCNLYLYDFETPGTECQEAHKCLKLVAAGEVLGVAGIAENGQRIYFVKRALGGQPDLDVYDVDTGQTVLVAGLSYVGEGESTIWSRGFQHPVQVTGEGGRFLLFVSGTPELTADDKTSTSQLFEYDAVTGELVRVSKGEDGYNDNGNAAEAGVSAESIAGIVEKLGNGTDFKSGTNQLNIALDGKTVVFKSGGRLSQYATSAEQGCASIYEFHAEGPLSGGSVHLLSDGTDVQPRGAGCGAGFEGMDGTGDNVLFSTADPLLPSDVDGVQRDMYDARVGGGFASSLAGGLCVGGCGAPAGSVAPGSPVVGSVTQSPEPPVAPPAVVVKPKPKARVIKCAKAKKSDHGKCVGVKSKKIARKAKSASRERRGK